MNIIASILILIAVILSVLVFISLIGWWRGVDNVLFPGLGIIAAMPAIIVLLLVLNIVFVVTAAVIKLPAKPVESRLEENFKYPNDIFSGCGNGVLDLSLAENPDKYNPNTDRALKICINYEDLFAIEDAVVSGRIDYQNFQHIEEYEKADENNRKIFQKFAFLYPMLGRINNMYQDYVFTPEEIQKLRVECLKLQAMKQNETADLALRKLIYSCNELLKDNSYLIFSSD